MPDCNALRRSEYDFPVDICIVRGSMTAMDKRDCNLEEREERTRSIFSPSLFSLLFALWAWVRVAWGRIRWASRGKTMEGSSIESANGRGVSWTSKRNKSRYIALRSSSVNSSTDYWMLSKPEQKGSDRSLAYLMKLFKGLFFILLRLRLKGLLVSI